MSKRGCPDDQVQAFGKVRELDLIICTRCRHTVAQQLRLRGGLRKQAHLGIAGILITIAVGGRTVEILGHELQWSQVLGRTRELDGLGRGVVGQYFGVIRIDGAIGHRYGGDPIAHLGIRDAVGRRQIETGDLSVCGLYIGIRAKLIGGECLPIHCRCEHVIAIDTARRGDRDRTAASGWRGIVSQRRRGDEASGANHRHGAQHRRNCCHHTSLHDSPCPSLR